MRVQQRLDYKFHNLGWRSGLYGNIPRIQHLLLSVFLLYRRGSAEGSRLIAEYRSSKRCSKKLNGSK